MKRFVWGFVAGSIAIGLSGCSSYGVLTLKPEEDNRPACEDLSTVRVEEITADRADCDLSGASLTFPDGTVVEMSEWGASGSFTDGLSDRTYEWGDVGNYGVVAGERDASCTDIRVWGSDEGLKRVREAFGEHWPCAD
jgi:hypothetical protein